MHVAVQLSVAATHCSALSTLPTHAKQVHVKVKAPTAASTPSAALHCYHGFGSNTWSWSLVQQQMADRLNALVTAHDMPGFGLTERWVMGCGVV